MIALNALDFRRKWSVHASLPKEMFMEAAPAEPVIHTLLQEISSNLNQAAGIADAAVILANKGQMKAAVELIMGVEDLAHLSERMLQAILLIRTELQEEMID